MLYTMHKIFFLVKKKIIFSSNDEILHFFSFLSYFSCKIPWFNIEFFSKNLKCKNRLIHKSHQYLSIELYEDTRKIKKKWKILGDFWDLWVSRHYVILFENFYLNCGVFFRLVNFESHNDELRFMI